MKKDIYEPYYKSDFKQLWFNEQTCMIEPFKIIRQLTDDEKSDYIQFNDYEEECYLIKNNKGKEYHAFDRDILEGDFSGDQWSLTLRNIAESIQHNDGLREEFLNYCKIEKFIKKHY